MKTVGISGKICVLLWHIAYKTYQTTAMLLSPCSIKMQPPARRREFVFHICRQISHYIGPFQAGLKENQHYEKLYIYDSNVAVQQHIRNNEVCDTNINP